MNNLEPSMRLARVMSVISCQQAHLMLVNLYVSINEKFERRIVNIFLSISFNICFVYYVNTNLDKQKFSK